MFISLFLLGFVRGFSKLSQPPCQPACNASCYDIVSDYVCDDRMIYYKPFVKEPFERDLECGEPTIDCFEWFEPYVEGPDCDRLEGYIVNGNSDILCEQCDFINGELVCGKCPQPWNLVEEDEFDSCQNDCFGFKGRTNHCIAPF